MMAMGQYLKELLSDNGLTIKELSNISGISLNSLYYITKTDPETLTAEMANQLSEVLNVPAESFLSPRNNKALAETLTQKMQEADMSIHDLEHYSRIPLNRLRNMLNGITRISPEDEIKITKGINYYRRMSSLNDDIYENTDFGFIDYNYPVEPHIDKDRLLQEFEDRIQELSINQLKTVIMIVDSMVKAKEYDLLTGRLAHPLDETSTSHDDSDE